MRALSATLILAPPLGATLVLAPPLGVLLWLSGAVPLAAACGALALLVYVVMASGGLLLRAARAADLPAPAAWVLGVAATSLGVYALVAAFDLLAAGAFALWAVLVLVLAAIYRDPSAGKSGLLPLLLCAGATLAWCYELAQVPQVLWRDGVMTTWTDQFVHGSVISQFGDARAGGRAMELAGQPSTLYHYASYMLPAVLAWPLDLAGLPLATSVWVPLGFLTACAGAYALGDALAPRWGGLAALAVLTLLPDPASYGLHNRLFGYYWYVLAVPGASYAVGVALLSIAFLQRWWKSGDPRALAASALLLGALALVRVHVFALAFPAWIACTALSLRLVRAHKLAFFGAALAGFALFVGAYYWLADAVPAVEAFLDVTHNEQEPTGYTGLYKGLLADYGAGVAVPAGVLLVLPACLGVFALLYPASAALARRAGGPQVIDAVPVLLIVCYVLLMFTAPIPGHGDATEFTQRPFVLLYAVVAIWTAAAYANWLAARGSLRSRRVWLPLLLTAGLAVVWGLSATVKDWRWGQVHEIAPGLPQAADYVRSRARPGDVLAAQGLKPGWVTTDAAVQMASMSGVPAYVTSPQRHVGKESRRWQAALGRYAELAAVAREESASAALARLRALGIQWYVVADGRGPRWDAERREAAFVRGAVAVYSAQPR
jgi:hypothetical protein